LKIRPLVSFACILPYSQNFHWGTADTKLGDIRSSYSAYQIFGTFGGPELQNEK